MLGAPDFKGLESLGNQLLFLEYSLDGCILKYCKVMKSVLFPFKDKHQFSKCIVVMLVRWCKRSIA